jgi:uncharacterized protein involved in exopolysaccharide biosynthesis
MSSIDTSEWGRSLDSLAGGPPASATERANRRRLIVFLGVFCVACAIGLAYDFLRPAQYRATSRLQITPASYVAPSDAPTAAGGVASAAPSDPERPFLTEVQKLSGRPLLGRVAKRLAEAGQDVSALGPDPVTALQSGLTVTPVPGTHVVELAATGAHAELSAAVLIAIGEAYRNEVARSFEQNSTEATARADDEVRRLDAAVTAKRRAVEEYRLRYNIVSPEREENDALAQLQGLGKSLQAASDRVSAAAGKLSALREAAAAGKGVVRARDNPTLASLERRASQAREDLRDLERSYTPAYLALDPNARALRARLDEMQRQIGAQRAASRQSAIAEAEEELAGAREAERRLRSQIAAGRRGAGLFAARFDQYKALRGELAQLESALRDALQRRARLEATVSARGPSVQVLEQAVPPAAPWRPRYWRDAALVASGSLLIALLAMAIVELFNRPQPGSGLVLAQPIIGGALLQAIHHPPGREASVPLALGATQWPQLERRSAMPRELSAGEIRSLLRASDASARIAMLLALSGISPEEALALSWRDVDLATGQARVGGEPPRTVRLHPAAIPFLGAGSESPEAQVLQKATGDAVTLQWLSTQLLCAAHDAGLERVQEITPHALRHTYTAFLVRQGVRFADLVQLVGPLPAPTLAAYSALAPAGARIGLESVNYVFPGLEGLESG